MVSDSLFNEYAVDYGNIRKFGTCNYFLSYINVVDRHSVSQYDRKNTSLRQCSEWGNNYLVGVFRSINIIFPCKNRTRELILWSYILLHNCRVSTVNIIQTNNYFDNLQKEMGDDNLEDDVDGDSFGDEVGSEDVNDETCESVSESCTTCSDLEIVNLYLEDDMNAEEDITIEKTEI